jgi:DNA gyrase/topoisomerase IV subunit A
MMVTKNGVAKKSDAAAFKDVRRSGLIAITLKDDDSLIAAKFVGKGDEMSLVTKRVRQFASRKVMCVKWVVPRWCDGDEVR